MIYSVVLVSVVQLSDLVMCDKSLQLCSTIFDPMDCSLPGYLCSWGFSRQGYWRGFPFPPPRDLPNPGIKSVSLMSPALAGGFFTTKVVLWSEFIALTNILEKDLMICL